MGSDISGEGSNDNTIEQNLQGAKKTCCYVASYHCGDFKCNSNWNIVSKWLFFILTNARHPVSIVLGQKAVKRFQKKMSGENRSLVKKRPQYLLSATNVAQPNKKSNYKNSSKFRFIVLLSS